MQKKKILVAVATLSVMFFLGTSAVFAQELPKADLSVWNSANMKPVRDFANITIGVIFGIATLWAVVMIAWYGVKLQSSGNDLIKSQEAKAGLKSTLIGVITTFAAVSVIGLIMFILTQIGVKNP